MKVSKIVIRKVENNFRIVATVIHDNSQREEFLLQSADAPRKLQKHLQFYLRNRESLQLDIDCIRQRIS